MKLKRMLIGFGILCLIAALVLTVYNLIGAADAGKKATAVVEKLEEDISKKETQIEVSKEAPTIVIDGVRYLGYLKIPRLDLSLPIAADYTFEQLYKSPALYSGAVDDGDAVIAAHNYVTHFGKLRRLEVGDELLFVNASGKRYLYTVGWEENILPSDREQMISRDGWDLTLFTCNYDKSVRFTVRCILK